MSVAIADYHNGGAYLISDVQLSVQKEANYEILAQQPQHYYSDYWKRSTYASKIIILNPTIAAQWAGTHSIAKIITRKLQNIIEQGRDFYSNAKAVLAEYENEDIQYIVNAALDGQWKVALTSATALETASGVTYVIGSGADEMIKILTSLANKGLDLETKALQVLAKSNHHELRYIDFHRELVGGTFEFASFEATGWKKFGYSYWDHDVSGEEHRSLGGPRLSDYKDGFLYVGDVQQPGKKSENWIVPNDGNSGINKDHFPCTIQPAINIHVFSGPVEEFSDGWYPIYTFIRGTSEDYFIRYNVRADGLCLLSRSRLYLASVEEQAIAAKAYFRNLNGGRAF